VVGVNDRARIPFALAGVLLLVSSATLSGALGGVTPVGEPATEAAFDEAETELGGALRDATRHAAREAAANPVVTPANTTLGRALAAQDDPFRAALELRVYLALRERLAVTRADGVRVNASLPPLSTRAHLRRALDRVHVEQAGPNGTTVRVRVDDVTLTASRGDRIVERTTVSPSVAVASPVLLLHERTTRYDQRLDADATRPGLARRTTARLYALAWTRGLAQYGGAPIANVVANRHVALAANDALLAEQRAVFGAADGAAARATGTAATRTAGTDLLVGTGASSEEATALIEVADTATPGSTVDPLAVSGESVGTSDTLRVGVNRTADEAFRRFTDGRLASVLDGVYRTTAERRVEVVERSVDARGRTAPAGEGWTLTATNRGRDVAVAGRVTPESHPRGRWHTLSADGRRVAETVTTVRQWSRDNETTRTTRTVRRTYRVSITVVGRHDGGQAPARPVSPVHDAGTGALAGPNLARVETVATDELVADDGGVDALARRAVTDGVETRRITVDGRQPPDLQAWVYRDLVALRERIRAVSVTVERGAVGTYRVDPAGRLAAKLRERRASFVDPPARYDGVAARARVAARAAYVDAVIGRLEARAAGNRDAGERFDDALADHGLSRERLGALLSARRAAGDANSHPTGDMGRYDLAVNGAPAYLSLSEVPRRATDATGTGSYQPLAARNVNLFTAPYGDVADGVVGELFGKRRTRLRTAALALRATNRLATTTTDERLDDRREELRRAVTGAVTRRRTRFRRVLRAAGVGSSTTDRKRVVATGLSRWDSPATRALAMANGSAADAVAEIAVRQYPDAFASVEARDTLRLELRAAAAGGGVSQSVVEANTRVTKRVAREAAKRAAERAGDAALDRVERRLGRSLARVPAGLPVTPVPAYWYVTTNVWLVEASGAYDRFAVRVRDGGTGRALEYVRDGEPVRIDWDGDGVGERAGRASEVDLSLRTAVVVVVPPGGQGVGDTDGNADERSSGWDERNSKALNMPSRTTAHVPRTRLRSRDAHGGGAVRRARI
jgi:hypothetical protein